MTVIVPLFQSCTVQLFYHVLRRFDLILTTYVSLDFEFFQFPDEIPCYAAIITVNYLIGGQDSGGIKTSYLIASQKNGLNLDPGNKPKFRNFIDFSEILTWSRSKIYANFCTSQT